MCSRDKNLTNRKADRDLLFWMADHLVELGCCATSVLICLDIVISFFCMLCAWGGEKKNQNSASLLVPQRLVSCRGAWTLGQSQPTL